MSVNEFSQIKFKEPGDEIKFKAMLFDLQNTPPLNDTKSGTHTTRTNVSTYTDVKHNVNTKPKVKPETPETTKKPKVSGVGQANETNKKTQMNIDQIRSKPKVEELAETKEPPEAPKVDQRPFSDFAVPTTKSEFNSKKRAFPATKHSPERNLRRMTSSSNSVVSQRTPPHTRVTATQPHTPPHAIRVTPTLQHTSPVKPSPRDRRISSIPSQKLTKPIVPTTLIPTTSINNDLNQRIRVCVRKRPMNKREKDSQQTDIVHLVGERTIQLNAPK